MHTASIRDIIAALNDGDYADFEGAADDRSAQTLTALLNGETVR